MTSLADRTSPVVGAASGFSRTCSARRRRRRRRTCRRSERRAPAARCCRCASGWSSTARIRSAPAATRGWIRSGLRSRTSTPSAGGATRGGWHADRRVGGAARRHEVRRARRSCAQSCSASPEQFVDRAHREAADLRARPRARVLRRAGGPEDRRAAAADDYRFQSLIVGVVKSMPFQMRNGHRVRVIGSWLRSRGASSGTMQSITKQPITRLRTDR